jgi:hypothetical protein
LGKARGRCLDQNIRQKDCKRLIADEIARAQDSMAESKRLLLTREAGGSGGQGGAP